MADSDIAVANLALLKIGATGDLIGSFDDASVVAQTLKLLYSQKRDEILRSFRWPWAERRAYAAQLGGSTYDAAHSYAVGDYVSRAPALASVVNAPESISTFVYLSLSSGNLGNTPETSPANWALLSRAAWAYVFAIPNDVLEIHGLYHGNRNEREDQHVSYELGNAQFTLGDGSIVGPGTVMYSDAGLPSEVLQDASAAVSVEIEYTGQVTDPKQFPPDFTQALVWSIAGELCLSVRKDAAEAAKCDAAFDKFKAKAVQAARLSIRPDPDPVPSWVAARRSRTSRTR